MFKLKTDFDKPKKIVMASPKNFTTSIVIDPITKYYSSKPDKKKALDEYNMLKEVLESEKIKVYEIDGKYPYSIYTRDLGVMINNEKFFIRLFSKLVL